MKKVFLHIIIILSPILFSNAFGQCGDYIGGILTASDTLLCVDEPTTLTLTGAEGSLTWVTREAGTIPWNIQSGAPDTIIVVSSNVKREYAALLFNSGEVCTDTSNIVTIYVSTFAENPSTGLGGTLCGNPINISASPSIQPIQYWSLESGPGNVVFYPDSTPPIPDSIIVDAVGDYSFAWNISDGTCTKDSIVNVTVLEKLNADAGGDTNHCGTNFQLSARFSVSSSTGLWTRVSGAFVSFSDATDPNTFITAGAGNYQLRWRESNSLCGSEESEIISVIVAEQPVANAGSDTSECSTEIMLNATQSAIPFRSWSQVSGGPGTVTFNNSNNYNAIATASEYGIYQLQWKLINSFCSDSATIQVGFFEQPVADAGIADDVCGDTAVLNANSSVGNGQWRNYLGPSVAEINQPDINSTTAYNNGVSGSYSFIWEETNNLCVDSDTITFSYFEQPNSNAGIADSACGRSNTLAAVSSVGAGTWSLLAGDGTADILSPNLASSEITVSDFGFYTLQWKEVTAFCSDSSQVELGFFQQPNANTNPGGNNCGNTGFLSADPTIGIGTWSQISGNGNAVFDRALANSTEVSVSEYDNYTFQWFVRNGSCTDEALVSVNFIEQPVAEVGSDNEVCGFEYNLQARRTRFESTWELNEGPGEVDFAPEATNEDVIVTVSEEGKYVFAWKEVNETCKDSSEVEISFIKEPVAYAGEDQELDNVFETTLGASELLGTQSGRWSIISGDGTIANNTSSNTGITGLSIGEAILSWETSNGLCSSTDTLRIMVYDIFISELITPNGDGDNDYFEIRGIEDVQNVELTVFNRWGNEVYYSSDYGNDWEGVAKSGAELTNDTYFYLVNLSSERIIKGFVVIKR